MYNGIGLTTPRGSGTNGHVQRNWASVRPGKKDNTTYKAEDDLKKLDASLNRPPNKEILDHDRKRKIEVKCIEFEEILEKQGRTPEEIKAKVDSYRQKLMGQGKTDLPKDEFGRIAVRETHKIAEAQQEKNAKLREAFNISEYFVEGSSFDSDRKAKEDLAKSLALQKELDAQREAAAATAAAGRDKEKRYALVRTPSKEKDVGGSGREEREHVSKSERKKKKKRSRDSSASPERKKDKKKKSKKHKKESKLKKKKAHKRKNSDTDSPDSDKDLEDDEGACSDSDHDVKKRSKRNKKDKKKRDKKKKKERSNSTDASKASSPTRRLVQKKSHKSVLHSEQERIEQYCKRPTKNPFRSRSREKAFSPQASSSNTSLNRPVLSHDERRSREIGRSRYDLPERSTSRRRSKSFERFGERHRDKSIEKRNERKRKPSDDRLRSRRISPVLEKRKRYTRSRSRTPDRVSLSSRRRQSPNRRENRHSPPRPIKPIEILCKPNTSRSRSRSIKQRDHQYSNRSNSSHSRSTTQGRQDLSGTPPPRRREQERSPLLAPVAAKKPHFNPFKAKDAEVTPAVLEPKTVKGKNSANPFKPVEPTKKIEVDMKRSSRRSSSSNSSTEATSGSEHTRSRTPEGKLRKISKERSLVSETRSRSARIENAPKASLSTAGKSSESNKRQSQSRTDLKNRDRSHSRTRSRSLTRSRYRRTSRSLSRSRDRRRSPRLIDRRSRTNSRERKSTRTPHRKRTRTPETKQRQRSRSRSHTPKSVLRKSRTPTRSKDNVKLDLNPESSHVKTESLNVAPKSEPIATHAESRSQSSHNSSELSYSPAIRNPERYRDILEQVEKDKQAQQKDENSSKDKRNVSACAERTEQKKVENRTSREPEQNEKNEKAIDRERDHDRRVEKEKKESRRDRERERNSRDSKEATTRQRVAGVPAPVVRLQGQSEDENDSDNGQGSTTKKIDGPDNLDEFQDNKREQLKDLKMLEQLKSGLAAKAKEKIKTIEKMAATSTSLSEPLVAALADSTLVDTIVSKVSTATVAAAESAARRSRSRSRRSSRNRDRNRDGTSRRSTSRSRSTHYSSSSSRSRSRSSRSHSRSRSRSSRSSCSSRSSSGSSSSSSSGTSRTGSRSPSIPRRRGSPSFLDRRRITSARKRPIPYHRKTPSNASSVCSSYYSRESSPSTMRSPTRSRSASFAC